MTLDVFCPHLYCLLTHRCLGTTQHLKNRHGSGYILEVKVTESSSECLDHFRNYVKDLLPLAVETECFGERLTFRIPQDGVGQLSRIFSSLEQSEYANMQIPNLGTRPIYKKMLYGTELR